MAQPFSQLLEAAKKDLKIIFIKAPGDWLKVVPSRINPTKKNLKKLFKGTFKFVGSEFITLCNLACVIGQMILYPIIKLF